MLLILPIRLVARGPSASASSSRMASCSHGLGGTPGGRGTMYGCDILKYHLMYPGAVSQGRITARPLCYGVNTLSKYWAK
ncbi:hypothetical protein A2U01_0070158, partial [Trifolium medium]|nr:hypothetical protein [Trifolium medium]